MIFFQKSLFFVEKNLSFKISSFNECSAIQLVKTGPVEFTKYVMTFITFCYYFLCVQAV